MLKEKVLELDEIRNIWEGELDIEVVKKFQKSLYHDPNFRVVEWDKGAEEIFYKSHKKRGYIIHPRKFEHRYSVYFLVCDNKEVYKETFGKIEEEEKREEKKEEPQIVQSYPKVQVRVRWNDYYYMGGEVGIDYYTDADIYNIYQAVGKIVGYQYYSYFADMIDAIETCFGTKGREAFERELAEAFSLERVEIEIIEKSSLKKEEKERFHRISLNKPLYRIGEVHLSDSDLEGIFEKFDSLVRERIRKNDKTWL